MLLFIFSNFLFIYILYIKQQSSTISSINSSKATFLKYNNKLKHDNREAYFQMTLAQKYLYLRNLYNYNSARNDQQKNFIYKQV
uniref:Uncharacterized protein n=1 Tax=Meloidogyne enterolobii TaxID=390850 RepID=A0A6V7V2H3_MELEN|nr:unnamed protein product [Meloidogyne enterolobii]